MISASRFLFELYLAFMKMYCLWFFFFLFSCLLVVLSKSLGLLKYSHVTNKDTISTNIVIYKNLHWKYYTLIIMFLSPVKSEAAFTHSIYF